jgi:hypothetical protein
MAARHATDDPLVSMRALNLLERLTRQHPGRRTRYRNVLIGPLAESEDWEIRLRVVRLLPLFDWKPDELTRVHSILRQGARHRQRTVWTSALESLAAMAMKDPGLLGTVRRHLHEIASSAKGPDLVRIRAIRTRLDRRKRRETAP